jgi:hypothetical protein
LNNPREPLEVDRRAASPMPRDTYAARLLFFFLVGVALGMSTIFAVVYL